MKRKVKWSWLMKLWYEPEPTVDLGEGRYVRIWWFDKEWIDFGAPLAQLVP